jgi:hypothetical protein
VHQHGTPAVAHCPVGDATSSQLPIEQDHASATEAAVWQPSLSEAPVPVHVPVHWLAKLTHLPLEQFESATQRHALPLALRTGAGDRVVVHAFPPVPMHATPVGAGWQPCPSSVPVPVQPAQLPLCELGMQWPLSHATSALQ